VRTTVQSTEKSHACCMALGLSEEAWKVKEEQVQGDIPMEGTVEEVRWRQQKMCIIKKLSLASGNNNNSNSNSNNNNANSNIAKD